MEFRAGHRVPVVKPVALDAVFRTTDLLARHEEGRAGAIAGHAHAAETGQLEAFGHAEIREADFAFGEENVLRLQVAMHESFVVGEREGLCAEDDRFG